MAVRFKSNSAGIRAMLCEDTVPVLSEKARRVKSVAEGMSESGLAEYNVRVYSSGSRATALVGTTDLVSRQSNAKHNSLLKGLGSA